MTNIWLLSCCWVNRTNSHCL